MRSSCTPGMSRSPARTPASVFRTSTTAPAPAPQTINVDIEDNKFTPNKITVPLGATVVWTHKGQRKHTVTADDGSFTSGPIEGGATFKQTFAKAGTFPYFCEFHGGKGSEGMAGAIIVAEPSTAAAPAQA